MLLNIFWTSLLYFCLLFLYALSGFCTVLRTTSINEEVEREEELEIKNAELNEDEYNCNLMNENMGKSGSQRWYGDTAALLETLFARHSFDRYFSKSNLFNIFLKVLSSKQTHGVFGLMYGSIPETPVSHLTQESCKLPEYKMDHSSIFLKLIDTGVVVQLLLGICADEKVLALLHEFKSIGNNKNVGTLKLFLELIIILGIKTQKIELKQLKQQAAGQDALTTSIFLKKWKQTVIRGMNQLTQLWSDNFWMGVDLTVDKLFDLISTSLETMNAFATRSLLYHSSWWHTQAQPLFQDHILCFQNVFTVFHLLHVLFDTMKQLKTSLSQSLPVVEQKMAQFHCDGIDFMTVLVIMLYEDYGLVNKSIDDIGEENLLAVFTKCFIDYFHGCVLSSQHFRLMLAALNSYKKIAVKTQNEDIIDAIISMINVCEAFGDTDSVSLGHSVKLIFTGNKPGANDSMIYHQLLKHLEYGNSFDELLMKMDFAMVVVQLINDSYNDSIVDWFDCGAIELEIKMYNYFLFPYQSTVRLDKCPTQEFLFCHFPQHKRVKTCVDYNAQAHRWCISISNPNVISGGVRQSAKIQQLQSESNYVDNLLQNCLYVITLGFDGQLYGNSTTSNKRISEIGNMIEQLCENPQNTQLIDDAKSMIMDYEGDWFIKHRLLKMISLFTGDYYGVSMSHIPNNTNTIETKTTDNNSTKNPETNKPQNTLFWKKKWLGPLSELIVKFNQTMSNPTKSNLTSFDNFFNVFKKNYFELERVWQLYPAFIFYTCPHNAFKEMFQLAPKRMTLTEQQKIAWESTIVGPQQPKRIRRIVSQDRKKIAERLTEQSPSDFCPVLVQKTSTDIWANSIVDLIRVIDQMLDIFNTDTKVSILLYSDFSNVMAWINGSNLGQEMEFYFWQGWVCYLDYVYKNHAAILDSLISHSVDFKQAEQNGSLVLSFLVSDLKFDCEDYLIEEAMESMVIAGAMGINNDILFVLCVAASKQKKINGNNVLWDRFVKLLHEFSPSELFVIKFLCNRNSKIRFEDFIGRIFQSKLDQLDLKEKIDMIDQLFQLLSCRMERSDLNILENLFGKKEKFKFIKRFVNNSETSDTKVDGDNNNSNSKLNTNNSASKPTTYNSETSDTKVDEDNNCIVDEKSDYTQVSFTIPWPTVRAHDSQIRQYSNKPTFTERALKHPHIFHNSIPNINVLNFGTLVDLPFHHSVNINNSNNFKDDSIVWNVDECKDCRTSISVARDCFSINTYNQSRDVYTDGIRDTLEMLCMSIVHLPDDINIHDVPGTSKTLFEWLYKLQKRIKFMLLKDVGTKTAARLLAGFESAWSWYTDVAQDFEKQSRESRLCLDLAVHYIIEDIFLPVMSTKQLLTTHDYWKKKSNLDPKKGDAVDCLFKHLKQYSQSSLTWIPDILAFFKKSKFVHGVLATWNHNLMYNKCTLATDENLTSGEQELIGVLNSVMLEAGKLFVNPQTQTNVKVLCDGDDPILCVVEDGAINQTQVPLYLPRKLTSIAYSMSTQTKNIHLIDGNINLPASSKIMKAALGSGGVVSSLCGDRCYLMSLTKTTGHYRVSVLENGTIKLDCIKENSLNHVFSTSTNMMALNFVIEKDATCWSDIIGVDRYVGHFGVDFLDMGKVRAVGIGGCTIATDATFDENFLTLEKKASSTLHDAETGMQMDIFGWFQKLDDHFVSSWIHTPKLQSCKWRLHDRHFNYWFDLHLPIFEQFVRYMALDFFKMPLALVNCGYGNVYSMSIALGNQELKPRVFDSNMIDFNQVPQRSIVLQLKFILRAHETLFWNRYTNVFWVLDDKNSVIVNRFHQTDCLLLRHGS